MSKKNYVNSRLMTSPNIQNAIDTNEEFVDDVAWAIELFQKSNVEGNNYHVKVLTCLGEICIFTRNDDLSKTFILFKGEYN